MALFSAFLQLLFSPCYFLGFIRCLCKCPIHFLLCHLLRALPQSSFLLQEVSFFSLALQISLSAHMHTEGIGIRCPHAEEHLFSGVLFRLQEHWMSKDRISHLPIPRVRRISGWEEEAWGVAGPRSRRVWIKRGVTSAESKDSAEDAASPGLRLERCAPGSTKARLGGPDRRNPPSGGGLYAAQGGCRHHRRI